MKNYITSIYNTIKQNNIQHKNEERLNELKLDLYKYLNVEEKGNCKIYNMMLTKKGFIYIDCYCNIVKYLKLFNINKFKRVKMKNEIGEDKYHKDNNDNDYYFRVIKDGMYISCENSCIFNTKYADIQQCKIYVHKNFLCDVFKSNI